MILRVFASLSLLALPACLWAQPRPRIPELSPPVIAPAQCELTDEATVARITDDLTWLASDSLSGRAPGTPGGDGAAEYIRRSLSRAGLGEAGTQGYLQPFTVNYGLEASPESSLTLTHGAQTHALRVGASLQPSRGTAQGSLEAELVFVGHGCLGPGWNDYAGPVSVRSRIAVILSEAPNPTHSVVSLAGRCSLDARLESARSQGARAVIVIDPDPELRSPEYLPEIREGIPVLRVSRSEGAWLLSELPSRHEPSAPLRVGTASLRLALRPHRAETTNLVGIVHGTLRSTLHGALVLGAHYDHLGHGGASSRSPESAEIHNGADDNASGSSVLLELARRISRAPLTHDAVFVWFGAEELGLLGSEFFVSHRVSAATEIRAMLNLDMVGRLRGCRLFVEGRESSEALGQVVQGANASYGFDARPWEASRGAWGASDHITFQRAGVPVMFLFTGLHDDYHRPEDDVARLNLRGLGAVAGFAESLVRRADLLPALVFRR